jgi:hypothetical protein
MSLMRHSDGKLTDKIYTDENLLGTESAIESLPNFLPQIASQEMGASGQKPSLSVTPDDLIGIENYLYSIDDIHDLALFVTKSHENENGGSGGARTRLKINASIGKTNSPSLIASHAKVAISHDLAQVVISWAKLSSPLKTAILAIIKSASGGK